MAAPFEQAYEEHYKLKEEASKFTSEEAPQGVREGGDVKSIQYREEEAIYIKASHDRVTVIFSTVFREETDRVFGKVFIQEFVDARRRAIQNAPQVLFRNDPPLELQGVQGVKNTGTGEIGYVTFGQSIRVIGAFRISLTMIQFCSRDILLPREWSRLFLISRLSATTSTTILKHQKHTSTRECARGRQTSFKVSNIFTMCRGQIGLTTVVVLNRARPENEEKERKTASGRSFKVQN